MKKVIAIIALLLNGNLYSQQWIGMDTTFRVSNGVSPGITYLERIGDSLIVGGGFDNIGTLSYPTLFNSYICYYKNSEWYLMDNGLNLGAPNKIEKFEDVLYVAGTFWYAGGEPDTKYIAGWQNNSWHSISSQTTNGSIRSMAVYDDTLYVVGGFGQIGGQWSHGIGAFDGANWHLYPTGADNSVGACEVYKGKLYIGGWFGHIGGAAANGIATYNGQVFEEVGGGILGYVNNLYVDPAKNQLYVGGMFGMAGDSVANSIIMWDGQHWHPLGGGHNGNILPDGIVQYHGDIYIGGVFTEVDGKPIKYIARWNGHEWDSLGLGVNDPVHALEVYQDTLWVGGSFDTVGGQLSYGIAKWYTPPPTIPDTTAPEPISPPEFNQLLEPTWAKELMVYPNPSSGVVYLSAQHLVGKPINLQLTNIHGQLCYQDTIMVATPVTPLHFPVPQGSYTLTIVAQGERVNRKIIVER